jgi:hypothetical protein
MIDIEKRSVTGTADFGVRQLQPVNVCEGTSRRVFTSFVAGEDLKRGDAVELVNGLWWKIRQ